MERAQNEISSREFTEWLAYYQLEPFGEIVADLRHGVAAALLANVNRDNDKKPEPYKALDFIPWADQPPLTDDAGSTFVEDPVAFSELIRAQVFGLAPEPKNLLE